MSLNGLEDPTVKEAHQAAVAEPGGWFLLKYASRDEIALLGRGNGGIVEIRNAIAQYEEASPLYGFLRYRRRNVIIKYLPENCSRLVQARVTVHFNLVCDRFSPHDTTFSIATPKELKDTKLSAACSLHAASGSTSSSTSSLRRRRLMEIAEEEEEEQREKKRQSVVKEEERSLLSSEEAEHAVSSTSPPVVLSSELATSPDATNFAGTSDLPSFTGAPRPSSPAKSFDDTGRRTQAYSSRPDLYSYSSYPYGRPKVKLGPRPSLDVGGRPRTSAGTDSFRPISTIPTGLKLSSKGSRKGRSQNSVDGDDSAAIKEESGNTGEIALPDSASATPEGGLIISPMEITRPHTSSGGMPGLSSTSMINSNMPSLPPPSAKQNVMTPEKARLMKAMKLREKKKKKALETANPTAPEQESFAEPDKAKVTSESPDEDPSTETVNGQSDTASKADCDSADKPTTSVADSDGPVNVSADQVSVDAGTDSHPPSPVPSSLDDVGDSTKASSLSESTDETAHPSQISRKGSIAGLEEFNNSENVASQAEQAASENITTAGRDGDDVKLQAKSPLAAERSSGADTAASGNGAETTKDEATPDPISEADDGGVTKESVTAEPIVSTVEVESEDVYTNSDRGETSTEATIKEEAPESPQFKIPLSKFSTQGPKAPVTRDEPSVPSIIPPSAETDDVAVDAGAVSVREADGSGAVETASIETNRSKRKVAIEPIRTDISVSGKEKALSDANFSDDDDLMDELQSATLQHAKPITVSKSPITPLFPGATPKRSATVFRSGSPPARIVRTVSNPIRGPLLSPPDVSSSSARAVSSGAAFLHKITQQSSAADLRPKTAKIGSSISQRIKALEMLSVSSTTGETTLKERPSSTFFSVRKTSIREPSRSPSVAERAQSIRRGPSPSPTGSQESSPETGRPPRDRSGSVAHRLSVFEGGNAPRGRPESIQVTARIVRDPSQPFPKIPDLKGDVSDYGPLELRQSPLVVDHQRAGRGESSSTATRPASASPAVQSEQESQGEGKLSLLQRRFSKERRSQSQDRVDGFEKEGKDDGDGSQRPRRRSSLSIVKDFIKDRRDSLLGGKSPSTDNLHSGLSSGAGHLLSPATVPPSRSPSRPPSTHQNSLFPRRLSISSRRSSIEQKSPAVPTTAGSLASSMMTEGSGESDGDSQMFADRRSGTTSPVGALSPKSGTKSGNRASRFMRRLSNSLGSGRKVATPSISPTVAEEGDAEIAAENETNRTTSAGSGPPSIVAFMGDVNVQFPDNLLWKRRAMCLDSQGFLILSAVQGMSTNVGREKHQAGTIKRYHLSDFRTPYTPEMELQELPNSVILDFIDGSGLQIACEDRAGQMNVLHILQTAHRNHTSFGQ